MTLTVVMPVYNEAATIVAAMDRVRAQPVVGQVVAVDDGSTDATPALLSAYEGSADVLILRQPSRRGKGGAVREGLRHMTGDAAIIQDADLEYDPAEYPRLAAPVEEGRADVVYGSRFGPARGPGPSAPRGLCWHAAGNRLLTALSNLATGLRLTDMETCYKLMRRDVVEAILPTLREDGFGIEPELTAKIARRGYRVAEVPIAYQGRDYAAGKKIGVRDGFHALWCILRYARRD
ncbi:MAG: glycosyltransferase family 2 protein [Pirellulales bacterium]